MAPIYSFSPIYCNIIKNSGTGTHIISWPIRPTWLQWRSWRWGGAGLSQAEDGAAARVQRNRCAGLSPPSGAWRRLKLKFRQPTWFWNFQVRRRTCPALAMHVPIGIDNDDCWQRTRHPRPAGCCNGFPCTARLQDAPSQSHHCAQSHLDCKDWNCFLIWKLNNMCCRGIQRKWNKEKCSPLQFLS